MIELRALERTRTHVIEGRIRHTPELNIHHVKGLRLKLQLELLINFEILEHARVGGAYRLPTQDITTRSRERSPKKHRSNWIIVDPMHCTPRGRSTSDKIHNATISRSSVGALPDRSQGRAGVRQNWTAGILAATESGSRIAQTATVVILNGCVGLSCGVAIRGVNLPAA